MDKISVLYIDDEVALLDIAKLYLEKSGVLAITTGCSALVALDDLPYWPYDAIISDYQMPDLNGIEFLKRIRADGGDIPFILFTGKGREEIVIEAFDNGADSYLQKGGKPVAQFVELEHKITFLVEQKRSKKALEESEKKYRQLIENAQEGICVVQDEMFVYFNPKFLEFTGRAGFSPEELTGQPFFLFIHPNDQQMMRERFHRRIEHGESINRYPFRLLDRQGNVHWFEIDSIKINWNEKPATLNFIWDLTDHYYLQDLYRESECRYLEMVNFLPKTVLEMDDHMRITFMNKAGREGFGYRNDDLAKNLSVLDLVIPEERAKIRELCQRAMLGESPPALEVITQTCEGTRFPMMVYLSPITRKNVITGFRAVCVDFTDFNRVKDDLSQANRKLHLLGNITSHDCRNKLTVLKRYLNLAREKTEEPETRNYLQKIKTITETIESQIEFTGIYNKIGNDVPEWQNCAEIVCRAKQHFPFENICLTVDLDGLEIYADRLLEKVIDNLFDNTLRHGEHATEIHIFAEKNNPELVLVYEDNGAGIPTCDKSQIFTCGFGKYTGLGLFLIVEILSNTGISIAETGVPGKGARFEIHIPKTGYRFVQVVTDPVVDHEIIPYNE